MFLYYLEMGASPFIKFLQFLARKYEDLMVYRFGFSALTACRVLLVVAFLCFLVTTPVMGLLNLVPLALVSLFFFASAQMYSPEAQPKFDDSVFVVASVVTWVAQMALLLFLFIVAVLGSQLGPALFAATIATGFTFVLLAVFLVIEEQSTHPPHNPQPPLRFV